MAPQTPQRDSPLRQFPEKSRERFLMPDELQLFYDAVMEETPLWRDLIFMLLFTGQRKRNVCRMQWKDIDLERGLWHVTGEQQKNGSPLVVVLPTHDPVREAVEKATQEMAEHWTNREAENNSGETDEETDAQPDAS